MNKVVLIGRLARDPEVRYSQAAEPLAICSFSVAVDKPYSRNRQEGEPTADFINCVCFGKRGESIHNYFRKGNRIALTGRIQTRSYMDQQNNKRYVTEVVVDDFEFIESKGEREATASSSASGFGSGSSSSSYRSESAPMESGSILYPEEGDDSDLPF